MIVYFAPVPRDSPGSSGSTPIPYYVTPKARPREGAVTTVGYLEFETSDGVRYITGDDDLTEGTNISRQLTMDSEEVVNLLLTEGGS